MRTFQFRLSRPQGVKGWIQRIVGFAALIALIVFALGAATLLTIAALAAGAVMLAFGAIIYLFAWLRRGRETGQDGVLNARKGPSGWTVDTAGKFGL